MVGQLIWCVPTRPRTASRDDLNQAQVSLAPKIYLANRLVRLEGFMRPSIGHSTLSLCLRGPIADHSDCGADAAIHRQADRAGHDLCRSGRAQAANRKP
jgi:hypothetical protein